MKMRVFLALTFSAAFAATSVNLARAQQPPAITPPYNVIPLMTAPVTGEPNKETVMIRVEWPANVSTGRHTHPGDEYGTVIEGALLSRDDGEEWKTYSAGQSYHKVTGVVHETKTGDQPAKSINIFVVEKGKPLRQDVK